MKERWIYDKDGNLKQINCYTRKDKFGNEKKTYKESLTIECIYLAICLIVFTIGGFAFWGSFIEFFRG